MVVRCGSPHDYNDADKIEYMIQSHHCTESDAKTFLNNGGFPSYSLSNNNATIAKTKERIAELKALHNQEPLSDSGEIEGLSWSLYEEDGRIKFSFDGKPSEAVRNVLKSNGFKWSRYSMAWVRKITANAVFSTKRMIPDLK